jgi:hypothetical protein
MVSEAPTIAPGRARRATLGALLLALLLVGVWWLLRPAAPTEIRGLRLGLSASDTRERFQAPASGVWSSEANPEPSLRWKADPPSLIHEAVFEFHQGMLVAIRLSTSPEAPEASGPPIEVSTARVVARKKEQDGRVSLTVLSRTCPAHATEVNRLLQGRF